MELVSLETAEEAQALGDYIRNGLVFFFSQDLFKLFILQHFKMKVKTNKCFACCVYFTGDNQNEA